MRAELMQRCGCTSWTTVEPEVHTVYIPCVIEEGLSRRGFDLVLHHDDGAATFYERADAVPLPCRWAEQSMAVTIGQ
jgi:hypothetical protein